MMKPFNRSEEAMIGIDLDQVIAYKHASFRFFKEKEHHITRFCRDNVLLLVFDGILRFSENGEEIELSAGEYYIQKKNAYQDGKIASDAPKYLYVHFDAEWTSGKNALPYRGTFDVPLFSELMGRIDGAAHRGYVYSEVQYLLIKLLLALKEPPVIHHKAQKIFEYIENNLASISSLSELCDEFHYSKNYIIRIFNKELGISPIQYINQQKIKRAMYLLETTSKPIGEIAAECGFSDYPYFYKRFVQSAKISPMEWRKRIQENPLRM